MARGSLRDQVIDDCAAKTGAVEDYPFGDGVAVFKVAGRMFALVSLGPPPGASASNATPTWPSNCATATPRSPPATT
jgi:hypothetical protein